MTGAVRDDKLLRRCFVEFLRSAATPAFGPDGQYSGLFELANLAPYPPKVIVQGTCNLYNRARLVSDRAEYLDRSSAAKQANRC